MRACAYIFIYVRACAYIYICVRVRIYLYLCACACVRACVGGIPAVGEPFVERALDIVSLVNFLFGLEDVGHDHEIDAFFSHGLLHSEPDLVHPEVP